MHSRGVLIWLVGSAIALGFVVKGLPHRLSVPSEPAAAIARSTPTTTPQPELDYRVYSLPQSSVHVLMIPAGGRFQVSVALSETAETVEQFAARTGAIAVLNAGFFDPANQQTTSFVTVNRQLVADPRQNERLMGNPSLTSYLAQILDRTEFRRLRCGGTERYAITRHRALVPTACELVDAVGGGPNLLPELTAVDEAFVDPAVGRDAIGTTRPNARTAIGTTADGTLVWVMASQKPESADASGLSLAELATFMRSLGVETAMNLDGGGSSSLVYREVAVYGRYDATGNPVRRPVKSVLLLHEVP